MTGTDPDVDDSDERARWRDAHATADLTPGPADGRWHVRSVWSPVAGERAQPDITMAADGYDDAVRQARSLACCRGLVAVWVYGPDGAVHHSCTRATGNLWLNHPGQR